MKEIQYTENAPLEWRDGQPYSTRFQDIYFSSDDGLAETDYVFLQGNDLSRRFQQLGSTEFTIMETGFGTGLNFLCAAKLWLELAPTDAKLNFISTEKYPLTSNDIATAHMLWTDLTSLSKQFLDIYQNILDSVSVALFDNRIQLTLLIGDANNTLSCVVSEVDAWFLDGFAPSKNPDMWQATLFAQMARLSRPGTTLATFTSAGDVRRGLEAAGFEIFKRCGFGKKREMLIGQFVDVSKA